MPFYQNLFDEFRGSWLLSDRQYVLDFNCKANVNKVDYLYAWNFEPYNFTSLTSNLTINYAWDDSFKNYSALTINVAGATPSATQAIEVCNALNGNTTFAEMFVAVLVPPMKLQSLFPSLTYGFNTNYNTNQTVLIRPNTNRPKKQIRVYISNGAAETVLRFNKMAGVANLPTYMDRHTIANRFNFTDSCAQLNRVSQDITAISVAASTVVTSTAHGLSTGNTIYIIGSNSTPSIDGQQTVTVVDANNFTVPVTVTTAGTRGEFLTTTNYQIVTEAGINYTTYQFDWQLLTGRASGLFNFQNITVDGSNRITQIIEYPAGSAAGAFARKINYTYSGSNTNPSQITEIPYVLQTGDIITPP